MGTLINLAVKLSGFGWLWAKVDGLKTYIAATTAILTGLLGMIQEIQGPLFNHDAGALLNMLKGLPHNSSWLMLVGGLGILGIGHKLEKSAR